MHYSGTNTEAPSNPRRVVVETSRVLGFMETALCDHFGAAAQYLNLESILYQLVENRISGNVMACCEVIKKQIADYGLETTQLEEIFDAVRDQMNQIFNLSFEYDISEYVCNFRLIRRGDALVEVLRERDAPVTFNIEEQVQEWLEEAEDNGDYVPERVRRALEAMR